MFITNISKKGRNAIIVFSDLFEIVMPYEYYCKYPVFKEDKYSEDERISLVEKIELFNVKQSSFRYLSGRNHSKYELKIKLRKKDYNISLIDQTIIDLEKRGFLNDQEFTTNYFKVQLKKKKGLLKIKAALINKGVKREIIDEVGNKYVNDPILIKSAVQISEKKINFLKIKELNKYQVKQKLSQFLMSRGFSFDIIKETLSILKYD